MYSGWCGVNLGLYDGSDARSCCQVLFHDDMCAALPHLQKRSQLYMYCGVGSFDKGLSVTCAWTDAATGNAYQDNRNTIVLLYAVIYHILEK